MAQHYNQHDPLSHFMHEPRQTYTRQQDYWPPGEISQCVQGLSMAGNFHPSGLQHRNEPVLLSGAMPDQHNSFRNRLYDPVLSGGTNPVPYGMYGTEPLSLEPQGYQQLPGPVPSYLTAIQQDHNTKSEWPQPTYNAGKVPSLPLRKRRRDKHLHRALFKPPRKPPSPIFKYRDSSEDTVRGMKRTVISTQSDVGPLKGPVYIHRNETGAPEVVECNYWLPEDYRVRVPGNKRFPNPQLTQETITRMRSLILYSKYENEWCQGCRSKAVAKRRALREDLQTIVLPEDVLATEEQHKVAMEIMERALTCNWDDKLATAPSDGMNEIDQLLDFEIFDNFLADAPDFLHEPEAKVKREGEEISAGSTKRPKLGHVLEDSNTVESDANATETISTD